MKHILLTSNGFLNTSTRSDEIDELLKAIAKDKKVLLIVNATKDGANYIARKDVKENFEKIGAKLVDIIEINKENVTNILNYDVIYGMGGNPMILNDDLYESNFKQYIVPFLKTGIYIGESAGSIVLCDNIKWVCDIKKGLNPRYDIPPKHYEGLGLVEQRIFPHYSRVSQEMKQRTEEYEKQNQIEITRLNDGEFIWA